MRVRRSTMLRGLKDVWLNVAAAASGRSSRASSSPAAADRPLAHVDVNVDVVRQCSIVISEVAIAQIRSESLGR